MSPTRTIAIIGVDEKIGAAIAGLLSKGNHRLILLAKDQDKLQILKSNLSEAGATAEIESCDCAKEASWAADVIIVATPYEDEKEVADKIREVATGKIVVSTLNPPT